MKSLNFINGILKFLGENFILVYFQKKKKKKKKLIVLWVLDHSKPKSFIFSA